MSPQLIPGWRGAYKLWSIRLTLLWGVFWMIMSGLFLALPAFMDRFPPQIFALLCVGFSVVLGVARLTKQPGLD